MSLLIACVLAGGVFVLHLFGLQSDLLGWRNARRGLYDLDALQTRTGIMRRAELEELVGTPRADSLYAVNYAALCALPRGPLALRLMFFPGSELIALSLAGWALWLSLASGIAAWTWVVVSLGFTGSEVLLCAIYALRWDPDDEEDELDLPDDEALAGMAAIPSMRALGQVLDLELGRVERSLKRTANHGGLTRPERWLHGLLDRWSRRRYRHERLRAAKLLESSEALAEQIRTQREALKALIRTSDDLDEAVELCEHEVRVEQVLIDLEGEQAEAGRS